MTQCNDKSVSMQSIDTHIVVRIINERKLSSEGKQLKKDKNKNTTACYFFLID